MKTAFVVSTAHPRFDGAVAALGGLGYLGVELAVARPADELTELTVLRCEAKGLAVAALDSDRVHDEEGLSLVHPDEAVRQAAVERLGTFVERAAALRCVVTVGRLASLHAPDVPLDEAGRWLVAGLVAAAGRADAAGAPGVVLAPLNRYETRLVTTVAEGLDVLAQVGSPRCRLLLDTFHMNIEETNLASAIAAAGRRVGLVHLRDSNGGPPGSGHLDVKTVLRGLQRAGYDGYVAAAAGGAELEPAAGQAMASMRQLDLWIRQDHRVHRSE